MVWRGGGEAGSFQHWKRHGHISGTFSRTVYLFVPAIVGSGVDLLRPIHCFHFFQVSVSCNFHTHNVLLQRSSFHREVHDQRFWVQVIRSDPLAEEFPLAFQLKEKLSNIIQICFLSGSKQIGNNYSQRCFENLCWVDSVKRFCVNFLDVLVAFRETKLNSYKRRNLLPNTQPSKVNIAPFL